MALPDVRQRAGLLLAAVVLGHIILISAQVNSRAGVPVLEQVTLGLFSEVQRAAAAAVDGVRGAWHGYVDLRGVQAQNLALKAELDALRVRLQEEHALAERSRQLQRLLELRDRTSLSVVAAEVVGGGTSPDFQTVTIGRGTGDGLRTDMAVLAPEGVVGRVVTPTSRAAKVQLLIDRNAAAGAIVERSRAQGLVVGVGDGRLRLDYMSELSDVAVGDTVVTSGIDGIFPKGFVIGRVESIERVGGAYREIVVTPAVDFSSLEEVLVVLAPVSPREAAETGS